MFNLFFSFFPSFSPFSQSLFSYRPPGRHLERKVAKHLRCISRGSYPTSAAVARSPQPLASPLFWPHCYIAISAPQQPRFPPRDLLASLALDMAMGLVLMGFVIICMAAVAWLPSYDRRCMARIFSVPWHPPDMRPVIVCLDVPLPCRALQASALAFYHDTDIQQRS